MIKIDTNEIDKFAVELIKLSEESRGNVQKAVKKSAFNIEAKAKNNLKANTTIIVSKKDVTTNRELAGAAIIVKNRHNI